MIGWLKKHHRKIQEIGMGLFIYEVFNFVYDWLFYPFAIAYWGLLIGGIIVVTGSLVGCGILFWLYDYMRVDWLGAHALRELEDKENKSNLEKLITWIGKKKVTFWEKALSPLVFVTLTFPIDPLIVAIHYRRHHFKGIGWKDWGILLAAVAAANAWWLLKVGLIVEGVKFLWHTFIV
jgi:hypothetical protein